MQRVILARHRMCQLLRNTASDLGFVEIETPMLGRSTPEGARDFLVPSRLHPGHFYALPQSPQLYKQILMVAGYDRYFQIARCFRDEDLRANRQPEFTQLDLEMSFVEFEDVLEVMERFVVAIAEEFTGERPSLPLPRLDYHDAVERFGSDRPDLRFGLELKALDEIAAKTEFAVFRQALDAGGRVRGICVPGAAERYSRKDLDGLTEAVKSLGAKGLVWLKVEANAITGPTAKFFPEAVRDELLAKFEADPGDLILIVADSQAITNQSLAMLRQRLATEQKLYDSAAFHYSWMVRFPLLAWDEEEKRYVAEHHPFTMPLPEDLPLLASEPAKVRAQAYDLVINGEEAAGGTIRCHDPAIQARIFELLGLTPEEAEEKFGFLLSALRNGAPSSRRDRVRARSTGDALQLSHQHPRLHRVPEDRQGRRPHDGGAGRGRSSTAPRPPPPRHALNPPSKTQDDQVSGALPRISPRCDRGRHGVSMPAQVASRSFDARREPQ